MCIDVNTLLYKTLRNEAYHTDNNILDSDRSVLTKQVPEFIAMLTVVLPIGREIYKKFSDIASLHRLL